MLFVSISFALGGQRKHSFQWNMGLRVPARYAQVITAWSGLWFRLIEAPIVAQLRVKYTDNSGRTLGEVWVGRYIDKTNWEGSTRSGINKRVVQTRVQAPKGRMIYAGSDHARHVHNTIYSRYNIENMYRYA